MFGEVVTPPADRGPLRVAGLHYGLTWLSDQVEWGPGVFPANLAVPGWSLGVTANHIAATPEAQLYDEAAARKALEPMLEAWQAELAVVHRAPMQFWFLGSDLVPDVLIAMAGRNDLFVDLMTATDTVSVVTTKGELPAPTWKKPPSELAREAREYCLLPLRNERRGEADAAYWLVEQLQRWAGSDREAAKRLNVSGNLLQKVRTKSARATDRKPAPSNEPLTAADRLLLRRAIELLVHRLHLCDAGEPITDHLTLDQL